MSPCHQTAFQVSEVQDPQLRLSRQESARQPLFSASVAVSVPFLVQFHHAGEVPLDGLAVHAGQQHAGNPPAQTGLQDIAACGGRDMPLEVGEPRGFRTCPLPGAALGCGLSTKAYFPTAIPVMLFLCAGEFHADWADLRACWQSRSPDGGAGSSEWTGFDCLFPLAARKPGQGEPVREKGREQAVRVMWGTSRLSPSSPSRVRCCRCCKMVTRRGLCGSRWGTKTFNAELDACIGPLGA
mgnify:CR=1 FL=1